MKQIYLIRHGQSVSNAGGEAQLNAQIALTELGHRQAQEVALWLMDRLGEDIDSINVSKFLRTQQTAKPLVNKTGITPTVIDNLQEFDYLSFKKMQGVGLDKRWEMAQAYWLEKEPEALDGDDAESYQQFCERVAKVLDHFKTFKPGNHVVYTHGLWISMLIWQILGQPNTKNESMRNFRQFEMSIRARNCEVFLLTLSDDQPPAITKVRNCFDAPKDINIAEGVE